MKLKHFMEFIFFNDTYIWIFEGPRSNNTAKAREIEELARQGICDIKPCCCDDCYPCDYERISEARELAEAKKLEKPKQKFLVPGT